MTLSLVLLLLKITCVLLIALCATLAMQRASAGSRHLVWLLALAALLVVPVVAVWAPLELPVLPQAVRAGETGETGGIGGIGKMGGMDMANTPSVPASQMTTGSAPTGSPIRPIVPILPTLFALWAIIAASLLARLLFGAFSVRRIVRRGRNLEDPAWQTPLYEIADRLGLENAPRLLQSDDVKMPFAAGLLEPTIVLPAESENWSTDRRSAVLIHELGHIRRRDLVGHTLGRIACAIYWFHPLVWTAARRLRSESEQACDDLALVFGARPSDYAEHLLDIVTCVRDHNTPSIALAMAHRKEFEGRMLAILNPDLRRRGPSRTEAASYAFALAGVALLIGAIMPVEKGSTVNGQQSTVDSRQSRFVSDTPPAMQPESAMAFLPPGTRDARSVKEDHVVDTVRSFIKPSSRRAAEPPDPKRAEILAQTLRSDASAEVRRMAAWGLQRYADAGVAIDALVAAVSGDKDAKVREMSAWALADAPGNSAAGPALIKAMRDADPAVRATAIWAVGNMGDAAAVDELVGALQDANAETRETAAWAIGSCEPDKAPAALMTALSDKNRDVRLAAAWALFSIEDPAATSALDAALGKESDKEVQLGMIRALGAMGDQAVDALQRLVTSPDSNVRTIAITALAGGGASGPWPWPRPEPRPYP
jgi:beta-lactamase regulating signal transducer with metallopeptidase domain